jgi:hypothetical protein
LLRRSALDILLCVIFLLSPTMHISSTTKDWSLV